MQHNPSFILRNWVTDEVVNRLTHKDDTSESKRELKGSIAG
jgi:uncharacterized protein YdiU (UPF0061 family)